MSANPKNALLRAIEERNMPEARRLLVAGASPDVETEDGRSLLAIAIVNGDTGIAKDLFAAGVQRDYIDRHYLLSPLQLAVIHGRRGIVALLLPLADIDMIEPKDGQSALFYVVGEFAMRSEVSLWILQRLLWADADCSIKNKAGQTPLMIAETHGQVEHAKLLYGDC